MKNVKDMTDFEIDQAIRCLEGHGGNARLIITALYPDRLEELKAERSVRVSQRTEADKSV